jgi:PDZ domain-containing protein
VGITVTQTVQGEDVTVTYGLEEVGGPSAGLMFSLGIVDELTRGSLTGGEVIAGTGTIDAEGLVGPIGGVQQKVVGAHRDGARYFLTPTRNCLDAAAAAPDGLRLVRVETLEDAVDSLKRIQKEEPVPQC